MKNYHNPDFRPGFPDVEKQYLRNMFWSGVILVLLCGGGAWVANILLSE